MMGFLKIPLMLANVFLKKYNKKGNGNDINANPLWPGSHGRGQTWRDTAGTALPTGHHSRPLSLITCAGALRITWRKQEHGRRGSGVTEIAPLKKLAGKSLTHDLVVNLRYTPTVSHHTSTVQTSRAQSTCCRLLAFSNAAIAWKKRKYLSQWET